MSAFWSLRGHHTEGRQHLGELLGAVPDASITRVSALNGAAWLAIDQGDYAEAAHMLGEGIGLSRLLGDTVGEGIATVYLGRCKLSSLRIAEAVPDVERAAVLLAGAGDRPAIAFSLLYSGLVAQFTGRLRAMRVSVARRRLRPSATSACARGETAPQTCDRFVAWSPRGRPRCCRLAIGHPERRP